MYSSVFVASLGDLTCVFADLFSDACIIAKRVPPELLRRRGERSSLLRALPLLWPDLHCHCGVWRLFQPPALRLCRTSAVVGARCSFPSSVSASCTLLVCSSSSCEQRAEAGRWRRSDQQKGSGTIAFTAFLRPAFLLFNSGAWNFYFCLFGNKIASC